MVIAVAVVAAQRMSVTVWLFDMYLLRPATRDLRRARLVSPCVRMVSLTHNQYDRDSERERGAMLGSELYTESVRTGRGIACTCPILREAV